MGTKLRVSFGSLLEELELRCRSDATELAAILKDHEERFLNGLSSAPPSADSRRKLDADSVRRTATHRSSVVLGAMLQSWTAR